MEVSEAPAQETPSAQRTRKHTILFLAANPTDTDQLALDQEARAIQEELERSSWRDHFEFVTRWAVQPTDLLRELRKLKPTIVHFSGHGRRVGNGLGRGGNGVPARDLADTVAGTDIEPGGGLFFQWPDGRSQLVPTDALTKTFEAAGASVKLAVLSACYSETQAQALVAHVGCVVGVRGPVRDTLARGFAVGLYGGLAERESVGAAFKQGMAAMRLAELVDGDAASCNAESHVPVTQLLAQSRVDPNKVYFVYGPRVRRRCTIVIKAKLADFDPEVIARVRDQLRLLSGDVSLEIVEVQEGSVRLTVSLLPGAGRRLVERRYYGELSQVSGFDVSSLQMAESDEVLGQDLSGAHLMKANLERADLRWANLRFADLREANLSRADLSGADLSGADLRGANLEGANLIRADLSCANLSGSDFSGANLCGANFRIANLSEGNLRGANLVGADLSGADLGAADLSGARLSGARLGGANLGGADLRSVYLMGADLRDAKLFGADLRDAIFGDAKLNLADLLGAKLDDAYLEYVKLRVELDDAKLDDAKLDDTKLDDTKLDDTKLDDTKQREKKDIA